MNARLCPPLSALLLCLSAAGAVAAEHWSFQPVVRPAPPATDVAPVDAFIRQALAERGLTPSPEADRTTLCRRVYFDLTGLPPSPEEVAAFVNDPDLQVYEFLISHGGISGYRAAASPCPPFHVQPNRPQIPRATPLPPLVWSG